MKEIQLTQNKTALVDDEDFVNLNKTKWCAHKKRHYNYYATSKDKRGKQILMHRLINKTPVNMDTDHIDGNGLNNQKSNLRTCTRSENQYKKKIQINNKSGFVGIFYYKRYNKYRAQIKANKINYYLGLFNSLKDALIVRKNAENKYHTIFKRP